MINISMIYFEFMLKIIVNITP